MARLPRLDIPGIPQHVVQHCNDRQTCSPDTCDYVCYLQELGAAALKQGRAIMPTY